MRSAFLALMLFGPPAAAAAERCTSAEIEADRHWSDKACDAAGTRRAIQSPLAGFSRVKPAPAVRLSKASVGVGLWLAEIERHERLISKSLEVGDADEMKQQSLGLAKRAGEVLKWPEDDAWSTARVHCSRTALSLMNFADYKLRASARGELAAESALKDYREAGRACRRGLAKLK